jgi:hypothetical protein
MPTLLLGSPWHAGAGLQSGRVQPGIPGRTVEGPYGTLGIGGDAMNELDFEIRQLARELGNQASQEMAVRTFTSPPPSMTAEERSRS